MLLEVWWSPAAECWRVEDGEMFTYYSLDHVIAHLKERGASALVYPSQSAQTTRLVNRLQTEGITFSYSNAKE